MALQEVLANAPQKRPGRPIKPLSERIGCPTKPIRRIERTFSRQKKLAVLLFLQNHRIPIEQTKRRGLHRQDQDQPICPPGFRSPTFQEASEFFKIPKTTVYRWWKARDPIVIKEYSKNYLLHRPKLEAELHKLFLARRTKNMIVSKAWFRRESKAAFRRLYLGQNHLFKFAGWFTAFKLRNRIVRRRITKKASKLPK